MNEQPTNQPTDGAPTACEQCGLSLTPLNVWHVQRECKTCGKTVHVVEPGEGGKGIRVEPGDRFVMPAGVLRLSLDRQKTTGTFTRAGAAWFVQRLHMQGITDTAAGLVVQLEQYDEYATNVLKASPLLQGFDFDNEADGNKVVALAMGREGTLEYWAVFVVMLVEQVKKDLANSDIQSAVWNMGRLCNARSMLIYKENLEETLWRGYTLGDLRRILGIWTANTENTSEEFWQRAFADNPFVLTQVFSLPVYVLRGKAYVGGKGIDNSGGKYPDFLLANHFTSNVSLVEIKTPKANLLGSEYRQGVYNVSSEVSGAVLQVSTDRDELLKEYYKLSHKSEAKFDAFSPQGLVIAGTTAAELTDEARRRSFELFRQGLKDVQVITFDELFGKVAALVDILEGATKREDGPPQGRAEDTPLFSGPIPAP